jgi:hypothetical protein
VKRPPLSPEQQALLDQVDFRLLPETHAYMSVRTQNALRRSGLLSAEQIMMASTDRLLLVKNFGPLSLEEVAAWREALMRGNDRLFQDTLEAVMEAMRSTQSIVTETQAKAAMAAIWKRIATAPFTSTHIRQMLVPQAPPPPTPLTA